MKIFKDSFIAAGIKSGISQDKLEALWKTLEGEDSSSGTTPLAKALYYLGGLIVIVAMTWFIELSWSWFGGGGIFLIALAYICLFLLLGAWCWRKKDLKIPGGLLVTMAVCIVPLAIYGLEDYFQIWPKEHPGVYRDFYSFIKESWIFMELGTIAAGLAALWFFPFPFLTVPIYFAIWFLTMDILPLFIREEEVWRIRYWTSLFYGLLLIVIGFYLDLKKKYDFGFWSYLFGVTIFWASLNALVWDKGEIVLIGFAIINLLMMALAVFLRRNVLMVFGAIGIATYLSHLAYEIFRDSIWLPFVMSFIGLSIVFFGILYQKKFGWIEKRKDSDN